MKRKVKTESLRWFAEEWAKALRADVKAPRVKMLAQLSYENARLRKRLDVCESLLFTMTTGMVLGKDDKTPHLFGCEESSGGACTCGSVPEDKEQR